MKVVHCKREPYDVYIGRGSMWGNPFKISQKLTREHVINLYKVWFYGQPELIENVKNLCGKILGCWCSPKPCHGDFLLEISQIDMALHIDKTHRHET